MTNAIGTSANNNGQKRIAIIGSGISGLTAAYLLNRRHHVTVFEANAYIGGHTATKNIEYAGKSWSIDTGFIVFNDWTYPNFIALLKQLGIEGLATSMSFSVNNPLTGLEYAGTNLDTLFCQRKNLFSSQFIRMVRDILRFNKEAVVDLENDNHIANLTLGEYLSNRHYGQAFIQHYLIPMGAAIWSASTRTMLNFPLQFFLRFFKNHGLLSVKNRPQWYVIPGGSHSYIAPLTQSFKENILLNTPVTGVKRENDKISVYSSRGQDIFDEVIFACHSDQALALLSDPREDEKACLQAIPYQLNDVVLHTDESLLPKNRKAWAAWNYHLTATEQQQAVVTYNMNILQHLDAPCTFNVTLNHTAAIDESRILGRYSYSHPVFTQASIDAQKNLPSFNGQQHTWFCGAWTRNGFHEDGVVSALNVAKHFGETLL